MKASKNPRKLLHKQPPGRKSSKHSTTTFPVSCRKDLSRDDVLGLCNLVDIPRALVPSKIHECLAVASAWQGKALIGFACATTKKPWDAYIEVVAVHPAYQRLGIGTSLMLKLLEELGPSSSVALAQLDDTQEFYRRFGFTGGEEKWDYMVRPGRNRP